MSKTMTSGYFDDLYARHDDPWGFESRWYEHRKRALTLAMLPEARYGRALEIGCSIGVLTEQLARRCDHLVATDVSPAAVERARERLTAESHVDFVRTDAAAPLPDAPFDLIVLSEVGYYYSAAALPTLIAQLASRLAPGGTVIACHWRHPVTDYPVGGDDVHNALDAAIGIPRVSVLLEKDFVLGVYAADGCSVAEREGLI
ncbi:MAG: class I SAM-dependent DNA methyltransferase [Microbacteriaceae bacterium]